MDTDEDESVMFQTDDESIDFQSEADNMSFMSRRTGRGSARSTPRASHAQPAAAVPAISASPAAASSSSSSDSDDAPPSGAAASPRGLTATSTGKLTTQTLAAHNTAADVPKKTVVSATLRARAASQRGRSPGLASPPAAAPPAASNTSTTSRTTGDAPQVRDPEPPELDATSRPPQRATLGAAQQQLTEADDSPPDSLTPPQQAAAKPSHHFDAAGVARMMQLLNPKPALGEGPPPSSFRIPEVDSEPSAAASPNELHLDLMAIQQHQRLVMEHQARHAAVEHETSEPPLHTASTRVPTREQSRPAQRANSADPEPSAESVRAALGWYRDLNAELTKENDALSRRLNSERASMDLDAVDAVPLKRKDHTQAPQQPQLAKPQAPAPHVTALRTEHRAYDRAGSIRSVTKGRSQSRGGLASTTMARSRASPQALDEGAESTVRAVAGRYGVILPEKPLTGDSATAVSLPDRLFFATGVQLTRAQRVELLDRMRAAIASPVSQPRSWQNDTELGSRAGSLLRTVQGSKSRIVTEGSPRRSQAGAEGGLGSMAGRGPPSSAAGGGASRSAPEWSPFTGPMRQRTRETSSERNRLQVPLVPEHALALLPKSRKRTEVLRDIFGSLVTHGRSILFRHHLQTVHSELSQVTSGVDRASIFADMGLVLRASLLRHDRATVLEFIVDLALPLLLLSGFEEFDFPIFSQILLRVADREALPADFAFQPTAQSPLAARSKTGDRQDKLDIGLTSVRLNTYLSDLCTGTAVGAVLAVKPSVSR